MHENPLTPFPTDLVITSKTFGFLRNVLIEHLGLEKAKRFLLRFGRELGIEKAKEILISNFSIEDFLKAALELHISLGHISNIIVNNHPIPSENNLSFNNATGIWEGSFEVPIQLDYFGQSKDCSCYILSGFASGIMTTFYNTDIFVKEVTCRARGDEHCSFDVNTRDYWEKNTPYDLAIYDDQTILDELEDTYDILLQQKNLLNKVTDFHSNITEVIAQQNDLTKVLSTAYMTLNIPVFITDLDGKILYKEGIYTDLKLDLTKIIKQMRSINHSTIFNVTAHNLLGTSIQLDAKNFAYCFFLYEKNVLPDVNDHLFLERLGVAASLCFLNEKVSFEATERLKINFLERLINQQFHNQAEIELHSKYISPKLKPSYRTISMKLIINEGQSLLPDSYKIMLEIARVLKIYNISGLLSQKNDHIILFLYDLTDFTWIVKSLTKICRSIERNTVGVTFKNGISNSFESLDGFYSSLSQAEQAMNFPRDELFTEYHSLGIFSTILENFNPEIIISMGHNELGPLLENIEKNQELLFTLYTFLKNSQKLEKTMKDLKLSIGGIKYRISKVEKMLNIDLKDATTAAHILLLMEILILLNVISFKQHQ